MILQAADLGCDASLLVTPMYIKPPQRGLVQFYHQMADLDALPIVMYNVPGRTGVDLKPETIAQCALYTNIIGVKEATGDVSGKNSRIGAGSRSKEETLAVQW